MRGRNYTANRTCNCPEVMFLRHSLGFNLRYNPCMESAHIHPKPLLDKFTQYGALAFCAVLLLAAFGQVLALAIGAPGAFVLTALLTLGFVPFILLLTTATPAVTVTTAGLTIHPLIWREQFVTWDAVRAVKDYPLLQPEDGEAVRKALSGRKRYTPAQGKMLVIPTLPVQYRIAGWLAGEGFTSIIAVTNRTHTDYETLIQQLDTYVMRGNTP